MTRSSGDAKRVASYLATLGIDVGSREQWFALELAVLRFYPNHIEGVISQVLSGTTHKQKVGRAREQGWAYFDRPVHSLLNKRDGAHFPDTPNIQATPELIHLYGIVTSLLLDVDMSRSEVVLLLTEVPGLIRDPQDLRNAIRICRDRQARSIHYLLGILRRSEQRRETKKVEILEARSERAPWSPPEYFETLEDATLDELSIRWERLFGAPHSHEPGNYEGDTRFG